MQKTFVLGVGAQKTGTSWVHRYLTESEGADFGFTKEYHIWDALHVKACSNFIASKEDALRFAFQNEVGAYERYFLSLTAGNVRMTGDITPSYSGLPAHCFREIKTRLENAGFNVKVIFLMRDPFERCWSAVRMARRKNPSDLPEIEDLRIAYKNDQFTFRTNYKSTIETLESVFERDQIFYGIYEELFDGNTINSLSDFVGCSYRPETIKRRVNVSPKTDSEAENLKAEIREFYRDVYDFCFSRFPQTASLWAIDR